MAIRHRVTFQESACRPFDFASATTLGWSIPDCLSYRSVMLLLIKAGLYPGGQGRPLTVCARDHRYSFSQLFPIDVLSFGEC